MIEIKKKICAPLIVIFALGSLNLLHTKTIQEEQQNHSSIKSHLLIAGTATSIITTALIYNALKNVQDIPQKSPQLQINNNIKNNQENIELEKQLRTEQIQQEIVATLAALNKELQILCTKNKQTNNEQACLAAEYLQYELKKQSDATNIERKKQEKLVELIQKIQEPEQQEEITQHQYEPQTPTIKKEPPIKQEPKRIFPVNNEQKEKTEIKKAPPKNKGARLRAQTAKLNEEAKKISPEDLSGLLRSGKRRYN